MKTNIIKIISILTIIGFSVFIFNTYYKKTYQEQKLEWGVLDQNGTFADNKNISINHTFAVWSKEEGTKSISTAMSELKSTLSRDLLLTLEPWPQFNETGVEMFYGVTNGRYDKIIVETCSRLQAEATNKKVYLRFGHEMDLANSSRYPWATNNAAQFINAYKYFVSKCRQSAPDIKHVWSPAGKENAPDFYPGSEWVDYTSISFFGYPQFETLKDSKKYNFMDLFYPKYQRVKQFNKPIFISEVAVAGDSGYKFEWMKAAKQNAQDKANFPLLKAFVYFNAKDNIKWDEKLEPPDFTIPPYYYP